MTTASEIQRQVLIEAFGESSGSENEAHPPPALVEFSDSDSHSHPSPLPLLPAAADFDSSGEQSDSKDEIEAHSSANPGDVESQRRGLGESLDSDGEALSLDSVGESSDMENQSSFSKNEAVGESSDSKDEIGARTEAQRLAILEAFGESSDSESEALGESSEMENQSLEESSDSENKALGESSGDEIEAGAEAQRRVILEAFGESSDNEDEAARKRAFEEVSKDSEDEAFGETSDCDEDIRSSDLIMELGEEAISHRWEMVEGIKGLWLCRDFLFAKHQSLLMQAIQREGWFEGSDNNQGMRFGNLPKWATELSRSIWEAVCFAEVVGEETTEDSCMEGACPLPVDILLRVPLFDQLIINVYQPGEGICAHVDLMRFDDGIAIVSLESTCVMHFTRCEQEADATEVHRGDVSPSTRIAVYLTPGSLVILSGEARYLWKHEINRKPGFQLWKGREIKQEMRTSVTLRKLLREPDES